MKTITINKIDDESYTRLMEFLNTDSKKKWVILDSQWWSKEYWHLMWWQLENHRKSAVLIVWPWAYSAAFSLFHDYKWEKMMVTWARGMRHKAYQAVNINDDWTTTFLEDRVIVRNSKKTRSVPYKWMTDKEKRQFEKWKDIYFDFERMQEIFPGVKIIK